MWSMVNIGIIAALTLNVLQSFPWKHTNIRLLNYVNECTIWAITLSNNLCDCSTNILCKCILSSLGDFFFHKHSRHVVKTSYWRGLKCFSCRKHLNAHLDAQDLDASAPMMCSWAEEQKRAAFPEYVVKHLTMSMNFGDSKPDNK